MTFIIHFALNRVTIADIKRKQSAQEGTYHEVVESICREVRLMFANMEFTDVQRDWILTLNLKPKKGQKKYV